MAPVTELTTFIIIVNKLLMEVNRMSSESAFDKRLAPETAMDQVEGLLEHFNLPPKVINFIRKNKRKLQAGIALLILVVVAWTLYGSHRDKIREESATALSLAVQADDTKKQQALEAVVEKYGSTQSGLWASVELAHLDMKNGSFATAVSGYDAILKEIKPVSPLYPLIIFAKGQAYEAQKSYGEATVQYNLLKEISGYEQLGYVGMARLEEAQSNFEKAIAILNNFTLSVGDDPTFAQARAEIDSKISRLRAIK